MEFEGFEVLNKAQKIKKSGFLVRIHMHIKDIYLFLEMLL